jgi:hypothetical protein
MHHAPVVYFGYRGNAWILHEYVIRSSQDPQLERLSGAISRPLWPSLPSVPLSDELGRSPYREQVQTANVLKFRVAQTVA